MPAEQPGRRISSPSEVREAWGHLSSAARARVFKRLERPVAEDVFLALSSRGQAGLLLELPESERRSWLRLLPPDDVADVLQGIPRERARGAPRALR